MPFASHQIQGFALPLPSDLDCGPAQRVVRHTGSDQTFPRTMSSFGLLAVGCHRCTVTPNSARSAYCAMLCVRRGEGSVWPARSTVWFGSQIYPVHQDAFRLLFWIIQIYLLENV
jgi:hypothetical protein